HPPRLTLFPYATLFRSCRGVMTQSRADSPSGMFRIPQALFIAAPVAATRNPDRVTSPAPTTRSRTNADRKAHCGRGVGTLAGVRSEEHTSELQSRENLV